MTGLIETLAIAIAAVAGAWLYGRQQRAAGRTEAHLKSAEAQYRRNEALRKELDDAEANPPAGADDARQRLRDRAAD